MTRLVLLSDVHADVHALRDALSQVDRLGVDWVICCGDVIDYGLFPDETIALLRERRVATVRGNHDRWALARGVDMSGWDLSEASRAFLGVLPTSWRARVDGVRVLATHARPGDDMKGIPPDAADRELAGLLDASAADVLLVGHTHVPFSRVLPDGRLVGNPGALLRDPAPGFDLVTPGTLGVLTVAGGSATFEVRRAADGALVDVGLYASRDECG